VGKGGVGVMGGGVGGGVEGRGQGFQSLHKDKPTSQLPLPPSPSYLHPKQNPMQHVIHCTTRQEWVAVHQGRACEW
jgi:hypothetical protein